MKLGRKIYEDRKTSRATADAGTPACPPAQDPRESFIGRLQPLVAEMVSVQTSRSHTLGCGRPWSLRGNENATFLYQPVGRASI